MAALQILSDLHLELSKEYDTFTIPPRAPYLALLGDIGLLGPETDRAPMLSFLERQLRRFRAVLFIPGNHEAYHSTWEQTLAVLLEFEANINVQRRADPSIGEFKVMNCNTFRIPADDGDTLLLGCPLFSHIPDTNARGVALSLNDFWYSGEEWTVEKHNAQHQAHVQWLNEKVALAEADPSVKAVGILTHWSPSKDERAVEDKHQGSPVSCAFSTDLSREVCWNGSKVKVWACGHTHYNFDFLAERGNGVAPIRVVANQRGYVKWVDEAPGFDEEKTIV